MNKSSDQSSDIPAPPSSIAVEVGQTAVNATKVGKSPVAVGIGTQKAVFKSTEKKSTIKGSSKDTAEESSDKTTVGGYNAADLLQAPIKPPHLVEKDPKQATSNPIVKTLVFIGIVLAVLGLIFTFLLNSVFGVVLMLLGALAIVACVFLPVGLKNQHHKQTTLSSDGGTRK